MLQKKLKNYIEEKGLFAKESKLLLAVSGGADSMAMLYMLAEAGYSCAVAHVNFQLRGEESDADTQLVKDACRRLGLTFYLHTEDTYAYAKKQKQSIEMAAREIRYDFFERVMQEHEYQCVAVAHHADDIVETFFINLMRGTGLNGITGIDPIKGKVVRPLLWSSHKELINYLEKHDRPYGTDSTNFDTTILRNKLRHDIIPDFETLKPGFKSIMQRSVDRFRQSEALVSAFVEQWQEEHTRVEDDVIYISKDALYTSPSPSEVLFKILQPLGFASTLIDDLASQSDLRVGAIFESVTYRLVVGREELIVSPWRAEEAQSFIIAEDATSLDYPLHLSIERGIVDESFTIERNARVALLNADKLQHPLTLRHWQQGDVFHPIGMKGRRKKVSDFFVDKKMSLLDKEQTWLLCSGEDIVWIVNHRLDDRFKVTDTTSNFLRIEAAE